MPHNQVVITKKIISYVYMNKWNGFYSSVPCMMPVTLKFNMHRTLNSIYNNNNNCLRFINIRLPPFYSSIPRSRSVWTSDGAVLMFLPFFFFFHCVMLGIVCKRNEANAACAKRENRKTIKSELYWNTNMLWFTLSAHVSSPFLLTISAVLVREGWHSMPFDFHFFSVVYSFSYSCSYLLDFALDPCSLRWHFIVCNSKQDGKTLMNSNDFSKWKRK